MTRKGGAVPFRLRPKLSSGGSETGSEDGLDDPKVKGKAKIEEGDDNDDDQSSWSSDGSSSSAVLWGSPMAEGEAGSVEILSEDDPGMDVVKRTNE